MRIVVLTSNLSHSVRKGIVEIDRSVPGLEWLVMRHAAPRSARRLLGNQWLNLRRNGWRWIPHQIGDLWQRWRSRGEGSPGAGVPGTEYTLDALEAQPNLRLVTTHDLHCDETLRLVREFEPDLGLSLAAPILRESLFKLPRLGSINLHKGRVPDYRGMPPAFWELWNGERSVGCTVHRVDAKLDTGEILQQAQVVRAAHSTWHGLRLQLDEVGVHLMVDAVHDQLTNRALPQPQPAGGKTYRKPTLAQVAELGKRLADPAPPLRGRIRESIKDMRASAVHGFWALGLGRAIAPRITVLLYHRVTDDVRDNLTVGIEQFDRQMALLRRHCRILSLDDVLAAEQIGTDSRPRVAVTFDDGYEDNHLHAAPILQRHGIPAMFFVATGIVGAAQGRFPHDVRRGNPPIPVMSWSQIADLRRRGFGIGSHSVSHIDCAGEPEGKVWQELCESRDALKDKLGIEKPLFGYPYGGRQHMTAQRLELVRRAGYAGCLSAYGGSNVGTVDRFNVLRRGIHWEFSDRAFLYQCLGL